MAVSPATWSSMLVEREKRREAIRCNLGQRMARYVPPLDARRVDRSSTVDTSSLSARVDRCLDDFVVPLKPSWSAAEKPGGKISLSESNFCVMDACEQLARHQTFAETALAELHGQMQELQYKRDAIEARVATRARRRDARLAFPYDPSKMLWMPTPFDDTEGTEERLRLESAARVRLFHRPTLAPPVSFTVALCGRLDGDLCAGAHQVFYNRFEFVVVIDDHTWQRNVRRVMRDNEPSAEQFHRAVMAAYDEAEQPPPPPPPDVLGPGTSYRIRPLHAAVAAAVAARMPGFASRLYMALLPRQTRESELVRSSPVPPALTEAQLRVVVEQLVSGREAPYFVGASLDRMCSFVNCYRMKYHTVVEGMVAVMCGERSTMLEGITACGVPVELATVDLGQHLPPWPVVLTADQQPTDLDELPVGAAVEGSLVWELVNRSAMTSRPSYFECFAQLLLYSGPFLRDALDLAFA